MTRGEFLTELGRTPRLWTTKEGRLRDGGGLCPIQAVALNLLEELAENENTDLRDWEELSHDIGLSKDLALRIVQAADIDQQTDDRRDMLSACGLGGTNK